MSLENFNKILLKIDSNIDSPDFYQKVFSYVSKTRKISQKLDSHLQKIISEEYDEASLYLDQQKIQDSCSVRNNLRTKRIASFLIDEKGFVDIKKLESLLKELEDHLYFLGPGRLHDSCRQEHLYSCLKLLKDNKDLIKVIQSIGKPHMHQHADNVIKDTLQLPTKTVITDVHARKAALSAWFCYLRQALGSCFATAPAIIIHDEQPLRFFEDIRELFLSGRLKKVFNGIEYSVPFNSSSGAGDLRRPFPLSGDATEDATLLSKQPGLILSLEKDHLLDPNLPYKEKSLLLKKLILNYLNKRKNSNYLYCTVEELLQGILLNHYSLTKEDLKEHELRPLPTLPFGGLIQVAVQTNTGNKGDNIAKFKSSLDRAKRAFKALSDNALLRSWEYTLASFAETKGEFSKWNLYSSLGLRHTDEGGIGETLYSIIKVKLEELNKEVEEYQFQYEQRYAQLKIVENRLKSASSEEEARWLKIDYRAKVAEFEYTQELRDSTQFKAKRMAGLFQELVDFYIDLFPEFFQEVYDPEIIDVTAGPYDDSPAGFRLLFKHGRSNTSQWTAIKNAQEYIEALTTFFTAVERRIEMEDQFKGIGQVLGEITTEIVGLIKSNSFLESSLYRMAKAHNTSIVQNPLDNLDRVEKKPWVYTSGGNLNTLVSVYYKLSNKPTALSRWVENPQELLVFLADTIKKLPANEQNEFLKNPKKSMLMYSPTHAFLLKPGNFPFIETWKNGEFTYTWIRDKFIASMERFNEQILLNSDSMQYLTKRIANQLPLHFQPYFKSTFGNLRGSMSVPMFRDYILFEMESNKSLNIRGSPILRPASIDEVLYSSLPTFPIYQLQNKVEKILSTLKDFSKTETQNALFYLEKLTPRFLGETIIGAKQLQDITKALICLVKGETSFPVNYHQLIKDICEKQEFAMPRPIIFADTNWIENDFAFLVNPGTGKFEFWRVDPLGTEGAPMDFWNKWLDGSHKHPDWGVLSRPSEYSAY